MDEHLERNFLEVELHEKIVVRERRRKAVLIGIAMILFFFVCGIPVFNERLPKWKSLKAARALAVEAEKMKTEAIRLKKALELKVLADGHLEIQSVVDCESKTPQSIGSQESTITKNWHEESENLTVMDQQTAKKMKIGFVVENICFDPVSGLELPKNKKVMIVLPVKDLAESRMDRASYIELESSSAKISIN